MPIKNPTPAPILDQTIALRLTTDECRALYELARAQDRTVSWLIRTLMIRKFLRDQQRTA